MSLLELYSSKLELWGSEERRVELSEGSFVLKLCSYTETRISISSGMILVSKAGLPLHLLPIVHECFACSLLAFQSKYFKTEHRIFTVIAFFPIIFPVSQLVLLLYETHCLCRNMLSPFPRGRRELMKSCCICESCSHQS